MSENTKLQVILILVMKWKRLIWTPCSKLIKSWWVLIGFGLGIKTCEVHEIEKVLSVLSYTYTETLLRVWWHLWLSLSPRLWLWLCVHAQRWAGTVSIPQPGSLLSFSLPSPVLPAQMPGSELGHLKCWHSSHSITPSRGQWCWKAERGFRWTAGGAHILGHCSWASQTSSLTAHSLHIQLRVCATWGSPNCYFKYNALAWMRSIKEECK